MSPAVRREQLRHLPSEQWLTSSAPAGVRYSVTVAPSTKLPKKKAGKEVNHRLPEAEDGWSTIAEAQNAAAARALFQVACLASQQQDPAARMKDHQLLG